MIDTDFRAALEDDVLGVGRGYMASIPARMTELTCLTHLHMELASRSGVPFDLGWVYSLVAMKQLHLEIHNRFEISTSDSVDIAHQLEC